MVDRRELIEHLDWVLRPPLPWWLIDQIETVVEMAVAGRDDELVEVDCRRRTVAEMVHNFELEELVAGAKADVKAESH